MCNISILRDAISSISYFPWHKDFVNFSQCRPFKWKLDAHDEIFCYIAPFIRLEIVKIMKVKTRKCKMS